MFHSISEPKFGSNQNPFQKIQLCVVRSDVRSLFFVAKLEYKLFVLADIFQCYSFGGYFSVLLNNGDYSFVSQLNLTGVFYVACRLKQVASKQEKKK